MRNMPETFAYYDQEVPIQTMLSLSNYMICHQPVNQFLQAVIANDLKNAIGFAEKNCLANIGAIVTFIYHYAPGDCWGSRDKYLDWTKLSERIEPERDSPLATCKNNGYHPAKLPQNPKPPQGGTGESSNRQAKPTPAPPKKTMPSQIDTLSDKIVILERLHDNLREELTGYINTVREDLYGHLHKR